MARTDAFGVKGPRMRASICAGIHAFMPSTRNEFSRKGEGYSADRSIWQLRQTIMTDLMIRRSIRGSYMSSHSVAMSKHRNKKNRRCRVVHSAKAQ